VSFTAITLCVASQRVFIFAYFVIDSVRKLLDTHTHTVISFRISLCVEFRYKVRSQGRVSKG
jgi:hypothetical protein